MTTKELNDVRNIILKKSGIKLSELQKGQELFEINTKVIRPICAFALARDEWERIVRPDGNERCSYPFRHKTKEIASRINEKFIMLSQSSYWGCSVDEYCTMVDCMEFYAKQIDADWQKVYWQLQPFFMNVEQQRRDIICRLMQIMNAIILTSLSYAHSLNIKIPAFEQIALLCSKLIDIIYIEDCREAGRPIEHIDATSEQQEKALYIFYMHFYDLRLIGDDVQEKPA